MTGYTLAMDTRRLAKRLEERLGLPVGTHVEFDDTPLIPVTRTKIGEIRITDREADLIAKVYQLTPDDRAVAFAGVEIEPVTMTE